MGACTRPDDDDETMAVSTRRKERRRGVYLGDTSGHLAESNLVAEALSHKLPTAADVVLQFGLYGRDGACAPEINARGEMACGCERCIRWKVRAGRVSVARCVRMHIGHPENRTRSDSA